MVLPALEGAWQDVRTSVDRFCLLAGALGWMVALTRLDLSHAYPFTALIIVIVVIAGAFVFNEGFSWIRGIGVFLIVSGLVVLSRG